MFIYTNVACCIMVTACACVHASPRLDKRGKPCSPLLTQKAKTQSHVAERQSKLADPALYILHYNVKVCFIYAVWRF